MKSFLAMETDEIQKRFPEVFTHLSTALQVHMSCARAWFDIVDFSMCDVRLHQPVSTRYTAMAKAPYSMIDTELKELR